METELNITPQLALPAPVNIATPEDNTSKQLVPNEYDFDIVQLLADVQKEEMPIPDNPIQMPNTYEQAIQ